MAAIPKIAKESWEIAWRGFAPGTWQSKVNVRDVLRTLACGIAGLSHAANSLSAIKYAKVKPARDERGIIVDFKTAGEFPCFGNNDDQANELARMLVSQCWPRSCSRS
jgi:pyruvate-formate lyase